MLEILELRRFILLDQRDRIEPYILGTDPKADPEIGGLTSKLA